MVTYLYWGFVLALLLGVFYVLGWQLQKWVQAIVVSGVILVFCSAFYYFYLEQMFVKRWGGTMTIEIPQGQRHIAATWKDDHLWIENYDPATNTCIFQEYSRGNLLEGRVLFRNCSPLYQGASQP